MTESRDMKIRWSDLWRMDGTLDRGPYVVLGLLLFALGYNLDRLVAVWAFERSCSIFNFLGLHAGLPTGLLDPGNPAFYGSLMCVSLPFLWAGVALTLRRLRAAGLTPWLAALLFVPLLNLFLLLFLAILPSTRDAGGRESAPDEKARRFLDRVIPTSAAGSALCGVLLTGVPAVALTWFSTSVLQSYGLGLFVGGPFCIGFASVLVYGYHGPRGYGSCLAVAGLSAMFAGALLLAAAVEGAVCLVMAAPLGGALALVGGVVGFAIQARSRYRRDVQTVLLLLIPFLPALLGAEATMRPEAPLFEVRTAVEVEAPPERVWCYVVAFSTLPEPEEWLFRIGIAYPRRAEIRGQGVGAERQCVFSTGPFVEPIEIWDEPRLLRFSVTTNPPPMAEWTPYSDIHPPHLDGFLVTEGGQFQLTPLPGRRTRLEGTTWYRHHLWPAAYWQVWSDFIIHRIHMRVLRHVERLAES